MKIYAIVAASKNHAIGNEGDIPWRLPADLKYFKRTTMGHPIIMGRKSFEAIGQPLPKRTNIIITRDPFYAVSNALVCHSLVEALDLAADTGSDVAFIIGGGEIYKLAWDLLDRIYYTEVDVEIPEADTFFPEIDDAHWKLVSEEKHGPDEKNTLSYNFQIYDRI
jgi:dihydrofolate reductase